MLRLIDQTRAFRSKETRPRMYRRVPLEISGLFKRKLETLTFENLEDTLSNYLHPRQIEAIIKRRDLILEEAENI